MYGVLHNPVKERGSILSSHGTLAGRSAVNIYTPPDPLASGGGARGQKIRQTAEFTKSCSQRVCSPVAGKEREGGKQEKTDTGSHGKPPVPVSPPTPPRIHPPWAPPRTPSLQDSEVPPTEGVKTTSPPPACGVPRGPCLPKSTRRA